MVHHWIRCSFPDWDGWGAWRASHSINHATTLFIHQHSKLEKAVRARLQGGSAPRAQREELFQ